MIYPELAKSGLISQDAKNRIELINSNIGSPMGAYTSNSKGFAYVRKSIAEFINQRDGFSVDADWNNIYLTNGASEAVRTAFKLLIRQ